MAYLFKKINVLTVTTYIVIVGVLLSLGFWQLNRAEQKKQFLEHQQTMQDNGELTMDGATPDDLATLKYRKVHLTGEYDAAHQFLLDNQHVNGKVGYFVLTPFLIQNSAKAVLINRGWLPLNVDRRVLPPIPIITRSLTLTGKINSFPSVGIKLAGAEQPTATWPSVVGLVEPQVLSKTLGYALYSFQIELDKEQPDGYLRDWHLAKIMQPEQHVAYAIQWFGLAFVFTLLFIWFNFRKQVND